jgi:predicted nucleotidyltransferase
MTQALSPETRSVPPYLAAKREELARLCARLGVRRLELFGSAARETSGSAGDLDFLVDLGDVPPRQYADAYFRLQEGLEALFKLPVDLVTPANLTNPHFRHRVEQEKVLLYAA